MDSKTILIADDEYGFRYPITLFLKMKGYNIIEAKNVAEVLIQISKANILIIDVIFPDNSEGIDVVKEIRKFPDERIRNIPVIFYSILSENACKKELEGIDKRSYYWLQKPIDYLDLHKTVSELL